MCKLTQLEEPTRVETALRTDTPDVLVNTILTAPAGILLHDGTVVNLKNAQFYIVDGLSTQHVIFGRDNIRRCSPEIPAVLQAALHQFYEPVIATLPEAEPVTPDVSHLVADEGDDALPPVIGDDDDEDALHVLDQRLREAQDNGLPVEEVKRLREYITTELPSFFRVNLACDPPAKVEPVRVQFMPSIDTVRNKPRQYSPAASTFLDYMMARLEKAGFVYFNPEAAVSSPAHVVRKAGADPTAPLEGQFRLTVDYRAVNEHTVPVEFPIPRLEEFSRLIAGDTCWGKIDLFNGFWQLPLHTDSQPYLSISTDKGVWTPTRVTQGARNSAGSFQARTSRILREQLSAGKCIVYVDDILVKGRTFREFIDNWIEILGALHRAGMHGAIKKTEFYTTTVKFCGRVFSPTGVTFDPTFIDTVVRMPAPANAAQLRSYIASANWLRAAIPRFAQRIEPLQQLVTVAMQHATSAKQAAAKRVLLADVGWSDEHQRAFNDIQNAITNHVTLAYPDPSMRMCVFTDASDGHWAGVVTQTAPTELDKPPGKQKHYPLAFVSGRFSGAAERWPTVEKEGFAIKETITRCAHLLLSPDGFELYTDHRNLVYIFSPSALMTKGKQAAERLERWAITLSPYRYRIHHISGEDNVTADLLSRWGATETSPDEGEVMPTSEDHTVASLLAIRARKVPATDDPAVAAIFTPDDFPTVAEIRVAQQSLDRRAIRNLRLVRNADGLLVRAVDPTAVYVPAVRRIRTRIMVVAHSGAAGHRAWKTTLDRVLQFFYWEGVANSVKTFCKRCLVCGKTRGGAKVPRPYLPTVSPTGPNSHLHMDYAYIRASTRDTLNGYQWVLVLVDAYSRFCELVPAKSADAETTALALLGWFSRYGQVMHWTSDQGPHFNNQVIDRLRVLMNAHHHFTAAYAPWSNGRAERVNKELREVLSALMVEGNMPNADWPYVLPTVQSILNNNPSPVIGGLSPITVFLGRPPTNPLRVVFTRTQRKAGVVPIPASTPEVIANTKRLQDELQRLYKYVDDVPLRVLPPRDTAVPVDFTPGDYVLVARTTAGPRDKTLPIWEGPAIVVRGTGPHRYVVRNMANGLESERHAEHLKRWLGPDDIAADTDLQRIRDIAAYGTAGGRGIDHISAHRDEGGQIQVRVHWEDATDADATWEPLAHIAATAPTYIRRYARTLQDKAQQQQFLALLEAGQ